MKANKRQKEAIEIIAKKLPKREKIIPRQINLVGFQLLARGIKYFNGNIVDKNLMYKKDVSIKEPINHHSRLMSAYKLGGFNSVVKYCEALFKPDFRPKVKGLIKDVFLEQGASI